MRGKRLQKRYRIKSRREAAERHQVLVALRKLIRATKRDKRRDYQHQKAGGKPVDMCPNGRTAAFEAAPA